MMNKHYSLEWLTPWEAAQHLKTKPRTLLLWVRQGRVKSYALSGTKRHVWRFRKKTWMRSSVLPSIPLFVRSERRIS
jgi:excisionase family DNA binding protein